MRRDHAGPYLASIPFQHTDAVEPTGAQLDEVAKGREPQMVRILGAIRQRAEADLVLLVIAGTLPRTGCPMQLAIDRHGSSHGRSLGGGSSRGSLSRAWMRKRPARGYSC